MNSPRPILHGSNISRYVRKVRVALAYKGIEYDNVQQNPFGDQPEYRKKSPLSKIPCWEEGDLILPDSSVILSYLEHRYPDPPLLPKAPGPRARALWFEEYGDTKVAETLALETSDTLVPCPSSLQMGRGHHVTQRCTSDVTAPLR